MYGMNPTAQRDANAARNRGTPGLWFAHTADYSSPRPQARVQPRAQATADKYRACESNELLHNYKLPPAEDQPGYHVRGPDGTQNAKKFTEQEEKWYDFEGNRTYYPDKPAVRLGGPKAQAIKDNQQQGTAEWYEHRHRLEDADPPPKGRIPPGTGIGNTFKERMHYQDADWKEHKPTDSSPRDPEMAVGPRTKAEGTEYALRSRGTAAQWMSHHTVQDDAMAAGGPLRVATAAAAANWEKGRGQGMRDCFDYTAKEQEAARTRPARRDAQSSAGFLQQGGDCDPGPVVTRTRPEGRANAEKNAGSLGQLFDQKQNRDYNSPRPQPRLPSGVAQAAADRNKGVMDGVLAKPEYQNPVFKKPLQPRGPGTGAAQEIATRNKGGEAKEVIGTSSLKAEPPPATRVTAGGEQYAERNKGSVATLFTNYGRLAPEGPPPPRMRPGAEANAARYRGSDFFKVIQQNPPSAD